MLYYDAFLRFCRANFCKGAIVCFLNDAQVLSAHEFTSDDSGAAAQRHIGAAIDYAIIYAREYFDRREQYPPAQAVRGRENL